jgi:uncharacterized protein YjbI with pentapeptide repeats
VIDLDLAGGGTPWLTIGQGVRRMGGHLEWAIARGSRLLLGIMIVGGTAVITEVGVASSTAFADTVIDGCTVVSNPTPTDNTDCVDMNLSGASLTNLDLSYADFEGSTLATTAT